MAAHHLILPGQQMAFAAPGRKLPLGAKPVAIERAAKPAAKPQ